MFDVHNIVQTGGILAVAFIIFAESGLLIGFFLPGDTLLLTAGLFAGQHKLPLPELLTAVILAAVIGYEVGYAFGHRLGPRLFRRRSGILLRKEYINKTQTYFSKYGPVTIIAARFIAHVRTFVSVIAGAGNMNRRKYFVCNVAGAILWAGGITLLGFALGAKVPNIDKYFFPVIIGSLVIIYIVAVWGLIKSPRRRATHKQGLREDWDYFIKHKDN
jgi:membrane-associated protein